MALIVKDLKKFKEEAIREFRKYQPKGWKPSKEWLKNQMEYADSLGLVAESPTKGKHLPKKKRKQKTKK